MCVKSKTATSETSPFEFQERTLKKIKRKKEKHLCFKIKTCTLEWSQFFSKGLSPQGRGTSKFSEVQEYAHSPMLLTCIRKQRHSLKLGKKRRESSKRNYYIISPRVIIKAIIIITRQKNLKLRRAMWKPSSTLFSTCLLLTHGGKRWMGVKMTRSSLVLKPTEYRVRTSVQVWFGSWSLKTIKKKSIIVFGPSPVGWRYDLWWWWLLLLLLLEICSNSVWNSVVVCYLTSHNVFPFFLLWWENFVTLLNLFCIQSRFWSVNHS